ncbi:S-adenosyl-L-methionine-dependent methyltransferase [Lipomyces arxii]|uniref:S-adenosyl-L-methionine-dependent methyltransferase n=1 Tax=Lipomyces arxii TaxID=56418 RepID=UPI0034CEE281
MSRNKVIQSTDTDALLSKLSASSAGYISDPLLGLFRPHNIEVPHKLPLLNRGTYARVIGVSKLLDAVLAVSDKVQIVSLGAGSDTRPFYLLKKYPQLVYHELDFAISARHKAALIRQHDQLSSAIRNPEYDVATTSVTRRMRGLPDSSSSSSGGVETTIKSDNYFLHGVDLRQLSSPAAVCALPGIDATLPTVVISECCLCYLEPTESDAVVASVCRAFASSGIISYEPFASDDQFGKVMVHNLASRGISIPTMMAYPTLQAQVARFKNLGFGVAAGADLRFVHDRWVDETEMARIDSLEMMDEREEFELLSAHYGIYWAATVGRDTGFGHPFEGWNVFARQVK